jgi:hypothetical protein
VHCRRIEIHWDSNHAIPTLPFRKAPRVLEDVFPLLKVREASLHALFAYPLSGGFRRWSLLPLGLVGSLVRLEDKLKPLLGPLKAFRLLTVVQRK